jgi:ABC-type sugar transport system ATPase subunit
MNELQARCTDGRWVALDGTPLCAARPGSPGRALLGVRAEHVAPRGGGHEGTVEVVEDAGHQKLLIVRLAGARMHVVAPRDLDVHPGAAIRPRIDPERVVVWSGR